MNNYFNFEIPLFSEKYGTDWDDFKDIIEDANDNLFAKTFQLYWLLDPDYYTNRVAEIILDVLDIDFSSSDTLAVKKSKIRGFLSDLSKKGMEDFYLDPAEDIVGIRGEIYITDGRQVSRRGMMRRAVVGSGFDGAKWHVTEQSGFNIYIDVKTLNGTELDQIEEYYRRDEYLPGFYQIYLIDSSFNILRTI